MYNLASIPSSLMELNLSISIPAPKSTMTSISHGPCPRTTHCAACPSASSRHQDWPLPPSPYPPSPPDRDEYGWMPGSRARWSHNEFHDWQSSPPRSRRQSYSYRPPTPYRIPPVQRRFSVSNPRHHSPVSWQDSPRERRFSVANPPHSFSQKRSRTNPNLRVHVPPPSPGYARPQSPSYPSYATAQSFSPPAPPPTPASAGAWSAASWLSSGRPRRIRCNCPSCPNYRSSAWYQRLSSRLYPSSPSSVSCEECAERKLREEAMAEERREEADMARIEEEEVYRRAFVDSPRRAPRAGRRRRRKGWASKWPPQ